MKFNIVMFKERYKNVIKVVNEGVYKSVFKSMCYLFENNIEDKNTLTAFNAILKNYVEFYEINNNKNTAIIHRNYIVDLSKMPIEVMEALQTKAKSLQKVNDVVNLLKCEDLKK